MANYFPYSHIILSLVNETKAVLCSPLFIGDWSVAEPSDPAPVSSISADISEIYY